MNDAQGFFLVQFLFTVIDHGDGRSGGGGALEIDGFSTHTCLSPWGIISIVCRYVFLCYHLSDVERGMRGH